MLLKEISLFFQELLLQVQNIYMIHVATSSESWVNVTQNYRGALHRHLNEVQAYGYELEVGGGEVLTGSFHILLALDH